ncbi:hypothetical protein HK405_007706 [Cladochytrium tenue]|nr:hypothetical protein HK405_007706 [Cladochytrium tenue]
MRKSHPPTATAAAVSQPSPTTTASLSAGADAADAAAFLSSVRSSLSSSGAEPTPTPSPTPSSTSSQPPAAAAITISDDSDSRSLKFSRFLRRQRSHSNSRAARSSRTREAPDAAASAAAATQHAQQPSPQPTSDPKGKQPQQAAASAEDQALPPHRRRLLPFLFPSASRSPSPSVFGPPTSDLLAQDPASASSPADSRTAPLAYSSADLELPLPPSSSPLSVSPPRAAVAAVDFSAGEFQPPPLSVRIPSVSASLSQGIIKSPVALSNMTVQHPAHVLSPEGHIDILRTKIVCTIGPASAGPENLAKLIEGGTNVVRLNLSHCTHEFATQVIEDARAYTDKAGHGAEVAVWIDINGPKVRTGRLSQPEVHLNAGDDFYFVNDDTIVGDSTRVSTSYTKELVKVGDKIYVDDGLLSFTVTERLDSAIRCRVDNSGFLGENKGINFPSYIIEDLPSVSAKDAADIDFAIAQKVDFLSVSCIRNIDDVEEVRLLLGNSKIKLLAKIENKRGMDNFESILRLADGVVIDRGYLGAEIDVEEVTMAQKRMIARANVLGKSVLVANQMLESMKSNPRPTRSEAADIANAVMDGADGLVLSAETAAGLYVFESLDTMRRVAHRAELNTNYAEFQVRMTRNVPKPVGVSESIASSAVLAARQVNATIIVCFTEYGGTARLVAKYRPQIPVIAVTLIKQTARQLAATFGLVPFHHTGDPSTVIYEAVRYAVSLGLCSPGEIAVVTSGQSVGFLEGTTTKMQLYSIPNFD